MSYIEDADECIASLIEDLVEECGRTGFLNTPTPERKAEIIEQIATLRASMNPKIIQKVKN